MPRSSKRTPSKGTKTPVKSPDRPVSSPSRVPKNLPGVGGPIRGVKPIPLPGRKRGR